MTKSLPPLKTNREYRTALYLTKFGSVSRKELDDVSGALNSPEVVRNMRNNGWDISCGRIEVQDRDGRLCRPGIYYVSSEVRDLMRAACEKWDAGASHSKNQAST